MSPWGASSRSPGDRSRPSRRSAARQVLAQVQTHLQNPALRVSLEHALLI